MGYSQRSCQICAVSFNIARLRTKDEPAEAGWGYCSGGDDNRLLFTGDTSNAMCSLFPEQSGCENELGPEPHHDEIHFPGRLCSFDGGYSGRRIGADEMKGMRLARYIVQKPKDGDFSDEEQESYERESDFFVTPLSTEIMSEFDIGPLPKIRFGIDWFLPQNYHISDENDANLATGVPIHEQCWDIFQRVSSLRLGRVDLQGFMALWHREACNGCGFKEINHEPMLTKCKGQHWEHLPGSEYLATNPIDIPGLMTNLYSFYLTQPSGDVILGERPPAGDNITDKFKSLPEELKNMILQHLSSKDIASLRLVSRTFRYLPKSLFLHLIQEEMPWFWEVDDFVETTSKIRAVVQRSWSNPGKENPLNCYVLYSQLRLAERNLLGLKNRVRIWEVAEEIVRRIQLLRDDLGEGEDLPLRLTAEEKEQGVKQPGYSCIKCDYKLRPKGVNY